MQNHEDLEARLKALRMAEASDHFEPRMLMSMRHPVGAPGSPLWAVRLNYVLAGILLLSLGVNLLQLRHVPAAESPTAEQCTVAGAHLEPGQSTSTPVPLHSLQEAHPSLPTRTAQMC